MGARPECNREKLRDILMDALNERCNTSVHHDTGAGDIREIPSDVEGGLSTAELFGRDGARLGEYDLVIDAMGLHSTLRQYAVDDPVGKHYEGIINIHGSIENAEASLPPEMMARLAPFGTVGVLGKCTFMFMQRYGAGDDNRTCLFYNVACGEGEERLFREMGFSRPTSRDGGILRGERLERVKAWVLADMGSEVCAVWKQAVTALDRVTVRGSMTHGPTMLRAVGSLPLVCIGDALRNCGVGGGGMLAMEDAVALGKALLAEDVPNADVFSPSGRADAAKLRPIVEAMLARKVDHMEGKAKKAWMLGPRAAGDVRGADISWADVREHEQSAARFWAMRLALPLVGRLAARWYSADLARGEVGSTKENALVYSGVREYLAKQK